MNSIWSSHVLRGLGRVPLFTVVAYASAATGLRAVAVLASYLPARRASRLDPVTALRTE